MSARESLKSMNGTGTGYALRTIEWKLAQLKVVHLEWIALETKPLEFRKWVARVLYVMLNAAFRIWLLRKSLGKSFLILLFPPLLSPPHSPHMLGWDSLNVKRKGRGELVARRNSKHRPLNKKRPDEVRGSQVWVASWNF